MNTGDCSCSILEDEMKVGMGQRLLNVRLGTFELPTDHPAMRDPQGEVGRRADPGMAEASLRCGAVQDAARRTDALIEAFVYVDR